MKQLFLIFSILFFSINVFAQRLEDKEPSNLSGNTLFAVQDSTNKYNWKQVRFDSLQAAINPLRTPSGNVAGVDSVAVLKGVSFYDDSTKINSLSVYSDRFEQGSINVYNIDWDWQGVLNHRIEPANNDRTIALSLLGSSRNDGAIRGWGNVYFKNSNTVNHQSMNFNFINLPKLKSDTITKRFQGYGFDLISDSDKPRKGQLIYNLSSTANGKTSQFLTITDSLKAPVFAFYQVTPNTINNNYAQIKEESSVLIYQDSTVVNNTLLANAGIKIAELSYTPTSSTDLQSEASTATVGTMWLKNISGSMYLITKISSTKLARVAFAEW